MKSKIKDLTLEKLAEVSKAVEADLATTIADTGKATKASVVRTMNKLGLCAVSSSTAVDTLWAVLGTAYGGKLFSNLMQSCQSHQSQTRVLFNPKAISSAVLNQDTWRVTFTDGTTLSVGKHVASKLKSRYNLITLNA
jgi:hypothetical protein